MAGLGWLSEAKIEAGGTLEDGWWFVCLGAVEPSLVGRGSLEGSQARAAVG